MLAAGCSTRKNTAGTRAYHALTTRYNVYFNGNEAYKAGVQAQLSANKDNYMEMLPLYPTGNKETQGIGASDFERAIEKAQKAIRQHSIKRRPIRKPGRTYTKEYRKWLSQREFNPFIYRAWMLLGKAQYQKGETEAAAATFAYVARLYDGQVAISSEAMIWLSRCYSALGWAYDAEDALNRVNNDSLPLSLTDDYASARSNYLLIGKRYGEAIPHLEKTARDEKNRRQKARCYYLLGQAYQVLEQPEQAYEAYRKVVGLNPPYELALSARIRQTEVMKAADSSKIAGKLLRLSRDGKNEEYLDQIYYALGNVYLTAKDTAAALSAYRKGIEKSKRNGVEKGILQLTLGNLYWQQARYEGAEAEYAEAQAAYADAIGLLDKAHREYRTTIARSEILDELVPYIQMIQLQDSLQRLAGMPEVERLTVIEKIVAQVITQEEEERKAAEKTEQEANRQKIQEEADETLPANTINSRPGQGNMTTVPTGTQPITGGVQAWYFYNPQLVEQGKAEFRRTWGQRKSEDNWRRKNKTVVALDAFEEIDYSEADEKITAASDTANTVTDAIDAATANTSVSTTTADTAVNDRHRPEYYLAQIPLTEEAMQASNALLTEALYSAGIIYKDRMLDFHRAETIFRRLLQEYPNFMRLDEVYYQLFLTELAINYYEIRTVHPALQLAEEYKAELIARFPDSRYARTLADPDFAENAVHGKQREDSLYTHAYHCFQTGDTAAVRAATHLSTRIYPLGQHRPKFLFLEAVTRLQGGETMLFLTALKELVQQYPENEITDLAAHILKGVQEGRLLAQSSHTFGNIWQRRNANDAERAGLSVDTLNGNTPLLPDSAFSRERNVPFLFLLAYEDGKVDEHRLLFEVARYNFSTFLVKNFDLAFTHERGIGMLQVRPFSNYDEAQQYFRHLYAIPEMAARLSGMRAVLISEANYEELIARYSFDDYDAFFRAHFASIPEPELKGYTLDEPLLNLPTEEEERQKEEKATTEDNDPENGVIFED